MISHKILPVILFALCVAGWMACSQQRQPCLTPKTGTLSLETIHFKTDTNTIPIDTALPSAVFSPVTSNAALITVYPTQASFTVSLSPDTTFCQWVFSTDTAGYLAGRIDTMNFFYRRHLQFLSNACGFTYFFDIDSLHTTHLMIDSVHILHTSVTNNVNTKHLQVYIHHNF